jgi:hypothetical protein
VAAVLAMNGVGFVAAEAALRALEMHLGGPKQNLRHPQEQRDAEDHDNDREKAPACALKDETTR